MLVCHLIISSCSYYRSLPRNGDLCCTVSSEMGLDDNDDRHNKISDEGLLSFISVCWRRWYPGNRETPTGEYFIRVPFIDLHFSNRQPWFYQALIFLQHPILLEVVDYKAIRHYMVWIFRTEPYYNYSLLYEVFYRSH